MIKGNGGIGFELASQLLADSSNHVLLGSRSAEKGEAAVKDLQSRKHPGTVELLQVDIASDESIAVAAKIVESKHGRYAQLDLIMPPFRLLSQLLIRYAHQHHQTRRARQQCWNRNSTG